MASAASAVVIVTEAPVLSPAAIAVTVAPVTYCSTLAVYAVVPSANGGISVMLLRLRPVESTSNAVVRLVERCAGQRAALKA